MFIFKLFLNLAQWLGRRRWEDAARHVKERQRRWDGR